MRRMIFLTLLVIAGRPMTATAQPFAYVANHFANTVSKFNTASPPPPPVLTIKGFDHPWGITITPDGHFAYVVNQIESGSVSVLDIQTDTIVGDPIPVGRLPNFVAVTPDGAFAYVTNGGSGSVSVIETATNTVVATITDKSLMKPSGLAITPDGARVYVANSDDVATMVTVIDTATNMVVDTVPVDRVTTGVAITPDGTRAYVTSKTNDTSNGDVLVIDADPASPTFHTQIASIPVGRAPFYVAVTPDGTEAWVTNNLSSTISVINTDPSSPSFHTVIRTLPVFTFPRVVAVSPDGSRAYVTMTVFFSYIVSVIDTATKRGLYNVTVGDGAVGVAITPF